MDLDLLAFGAHPDDVEIGSGGILASHAAMGYKCAIIDLTAGEMSTNGTVDERNAEAQEAAGVLKCISRTCLGLPDAHLSLGEKCLYKVAEAIRAFRPRIILAPYYGNDRHPDHSTAGDLVKRASFLAGLKRLPIDNEPFRAEKLYFFLLTVDETPDLVVDISSVYGIKEKAIKAHRSQFSLHNSTLPTTVNDPSFLRYIHSRDSFFGSLAGVSWGEGLIVNEKPRVSDLIKWGGV